MWMCLLASSAFKFLDYNVQFRQIESKKKERPTMIEVSMAMREFLSVTSRPYVMIYAHYNFLLQHARFFCKNNFFKNTSLRFFED